MGRAADPVAAVLAAHAAGRPLVLRTSGTSGRPRSVVRSTASWVRSFPYVAGLTGLGRGSVLWLPGPLSSTMNLFAATLARHVGATVRTDPAAVEGATHAHLTPWTLLRALDQPVSLAGVRVTVAGDRLTHDLRVRAEQAGATVSHYYGAAELSFVAWGTDERDLRAFPEVDLAVRDGQIWVRSPYLCRGYDEAGSQGPLAVDPDGFATVGDRGRLEDGRLLVEGRGTDTVITGGATVLVAEVENTLAVGLTGSLVVVGVPHPTLGQVVAAVVSDPDDAALARARGHEQLAAAQRPRLWFHLERLPLTAAGKPDRDLLAAELRHARRLVPTSVRPPAAAP